jgi:hypothetical protein
MRVTLSNAHKDGVGFQGKEGVGVSSNFRQTRDSTYIECRIKSPRLY